MRKRYVRPVQFQVQRLHEPPFFLILNDEKAGKARVGLAGAGSVGMRVIPVGAAPVLDGVGIAVAGVGGHWSEGMAIHAPIYVQPVPVNSGLLIESVG